MTAKKFSKAAIKTIQSELLDRRRLLLADTRSKLDEVLGDHDSGDDIDQASAAYEQSMAMDGAARDVHELNLIDEALGRIEDGSYGGCCECGEAIGSARLKVLPFAEYCINCQEKLEEEGALPSMLERRT